MEREYTQEEIQKSILAAYDSVNLINQLKAKESLNEEETNTLDRNTKHIEIMLGKEWFSNGLTKAQKKELQSIIA